MSLYYKYMSLLVVGMIFLLPVSAQNLDLSKYRWTELEVTGDAVARHENAFIEFEGKFYLLGGRGINPVNVFDPETKTWETKSKSPIEIHHFQAVVYEDAIYLLGAMTGGYPKEPPLENIWKYYPKEDKWEKGDVIPSEYQRGGAGTVVYNGVFYMACGIELGHTSGTTNLFNSYNPKTGEWKTLTKAPHIRDHFPAIVVDDKLYCIGGRNSSYHTKKQFTAFFDAVVPFVDVYDFKTEKWISLEEELPYPTAAGSLVHIDNRLIYIGGEGPFKTAYNQTQCLDLETGLWSQLAPLYTGRHGTGAILFRNNIYIAAGSPNRGGGNISSVEVFSAAHQWTALFDGESLDEWSVKCVEADKNTDFWSVQDGAIVVNSMNHDRHNYVWLVNENEYGDFVLRLKFQVSRESTGNSGVQVRSRYDERVKVQFNNETQYGWLDGPQVDINPGDPFRNGLIYDETRGHKRWISPSLEDWKIDKQKYAPKKIIYYWEDQGPGWNDMTIVCKGNHIKTIVNNVVVSDYDGTGVLDDKHHKKYKTGLSGNIAIQIHAKSQLLMRYKDVELMEL